jgi:AcrR family transcriptional regulator
MKQVESGKTGPSASAAEPPARERILHAAFVAFTSNGYAGASTLAIATRAKVSKRELYSLFGSKRAILVACISERMIRMLPPADGPAIRDRDTLAGALTTFGAILVREISHPAVLAVFRLAIAEAKRAPEVAQVLECEGRRPGRAVVNGIMARAMAAGLLAGGDADDLAGQFLALLWRDLLLGLLLDVVAPPQSDDIERRAANATAVFLGLNGMGTDRTT